MEERQERQAERDIVEARNQYRMISEPSEMDLSPPPHVRAGRGGGGDGGAGAAGGGGGGGGVHAPPTAARAGPSSRPASGKGGVRPRSGSNSLSNSLSNSRAQEQRDALASLGRGQGRPSSGATRPAGAAPARGLGRRGRTPSDKSDVEQGSPSTQGSPSRGRTRSASSDLAEQAAEAEEEVGMG